MPGWRPFALAVLLCAAMPGAWPEEPAWPGASWEAADPAVLGLDVEKLHAARDYAAAAGGSGKVIYRGRQVLAWGDPARRYDLKSSTKSIGFTAMGLALADGNVDLHASAHTLHPDFAVPPETNRDQGWDRAITLFHLATQTAGFDKPGGYGDLLFPPGTAWSYSDAGPNWLAECLTHVYKRDLRDLLFERFFSPIGITTDDLTWRDNAYRDHRFEGVPRREFGSGISANVDAMARIGYCYLRHGRWAGRQFIPASFVDLVRTTPDVVRGLPVRLPEQYPGASNHYGLLWWNNNDHAMPGVPADTYWTWGLYDSLIVVSPGLDLVIARAGRSFEEGWRGGFVKVEPFITSLVSALPEARAALLPPATGVTSLAWDPPETVRRAAEGSDNWPLAWGDDGRLYTAYGDGWGFDPRREDKLSLGLAVVEGGPADFHGTNLPAPTAERSGDGDRGVKASGMVMADGVLYLLARNAENAQLAWSEDLGQTWAWADWRFTESFGCPAFLDAGRNSENATDGFVYVVSQDADSAYDVADGFVLARAEALHLRERDAWRFFAGWDGDGAPGWSADAADRVPVLRLAGGCYRGSMTWVPALDRFLLCTILRDPPEGGNPGLGVFEADQPWGPWRTVYLDRSWDIDPGESARIPSKWAGPDTLHLVFSGGDCFAVRCATLR